MSRPAAFVFPDNLAALATCRELGRAGIEVDVLGARKGPAARSRYARFREVPDFYRNAAAWSSEVVRLAVEHATPPILFATEDAALLVSDCLAEELGRALTFPHPVPGVTPKILDKLQLYGAAAALGIGVPRFREVERGEAVEELAELAEEECRWLAKPSCRYRIDDAGRVRTFLSVSGGTKALGGNIASAATTVLDAGFRCVLQELIPGPFEELVSVGMCIAPSGEVIASYTARKRCEYPEPFGDGLLVETITDPGITDTAATLLRGLGYWGVCDVEFKRDRRDGIFKLLDANPRVWLWHDLGTFAGGAALALTSYQLAADGGRTSAPVSAVYAARARGIPTWVSPRGAAAFLVSAYNPRRHGLALPFRLTLGALRTMLRNSKAFRDPLYLRPSAWPDLAAAAWQRTRRLLHRG